MASEDLPIEIVDRVRDVVRNELGRFGAEAIDVEAGENYAGDPAIFVRVHYRGGDGNLAPGAASSALFKLNDALYAAGEHRFAYISHAPLD